MYPKEPGSPLSPESNWKWPWHPLPTKEKTPLAMSSRNEFSVADGDRELGGEGILSKAKSVNLISQEAPATCRKNSTAAVLSRPKRSCSRFRKHVETPSLPRALAYCKKSLRLARKAMHLAMTSTSTCCRKGAVVGSEGPSSNTRGSIISYRAPQALISRKRGHHGARRLFQESVQ